MIEHFGYRFDYKYEMMGGLLKGQGHMHFEEDQTFAMATIKLEATEKGHFYPKLHDLNVRFGRSEINVDNSTVAAHIYRASFNIVKHITMNAINTFGLSIYNPMLPEFTRRLLSD